jgi:UDP-N-acetylglucosamine 1-carboxyvinyltransferase
MDKIIVEGGYPLSGEVKISGAKNAALPMLISSLLTDGTCTFKNVPDLMDIKSTSMLLSHLGARVETRKNTIRIDAADLAQFEAPYDLVRKMRASVLVLGPLVARLGRARVSLPGGCAIGARPINLHLQGLAALGAAIELKHGYVEASAGRLKGADIYFDVVTVTGTENLMMAAALAKGTTVLRNAAREPEIVSLAETLIKMGADIEGAGTSTITINGVAALNPVVATIIPDRIEAGTFMMAAILTRGEVTLLNCEPDHVGALIDKLRLTGAEIDISGKSIHVKSRQNIASVDVQTQPSETIFENRFIHVSELRRMGADIQVSGNIAIVKGVPHLSAAQVMATDLRASASLILAGLAAHGKTEVNRVYHLDRGYQSIEKKFSALNASIKRVK